jgi:glutamyl-tRNA reductase
VIERDELAEVMAEREGRPLLLMDLAVPRDLSPACREEQGVTVYDMDDLQSVVERNASSREGEAAKAEKILRAELAQFEEWLAAQEVTPTIAALRGLADEIVARTLAENESRWEGLSDADRRRMEAMANAIARRVLHEPTLRLKRSATEGVADHVHALRELFGLDPESGTLEGAGAEVTELDDHRRTRRP